MLSNVLSGNEVLDKKETVLEIIKRSDFDFYLEYIFSCRVSVRLKDDKEVVCSAVMKRGSLLEYASDRLKDDKDVVLQAVKRNGDVVEYASTRLKDDKQVALEAISGCCDFRIDYPYVLEHLSARLRDDKEVVFNAVALHGNALEYASNRLKDDQDIVLEAMKSEEGYEYASERLRDNKDIIFYAVRRNRQESRVGWVHPIRFASSRLRDDKDFILDLIKQDGDILEYASDRLKDDNDIVLASINQNVLALKYASDRIKNDHYVRLKAIRLSNDTLQEREIDEWKIDPRYVNKKIGLMIKVSFVIFLVSIAFGKYANSWWTIIILIGLALFWWLKFTARERATQRVEKEEREQEVIVKRKNEQEKNAEILREQRNTECAVRRLLRGEIEKMPKYSNWRNAIYGKCGRVCEICGEIKELEIHHRRSFDSILRAYHIETTVQAFECEALWAIDNGSVLCKQCHKKMESSKYYNLHN